jgi:TonB family protein
MYFDFDDRFKDIEPVGRAINRRDGVALAVVVHVAIVLVFLFAPQYLPARPLAKPLIPPPDQQRAPQFVFVQPKVDLQALRPPERADVSDLDRKARSVEPPAKPSNPLPFARGDSPERVESSPDERMRGRGPTPEPAPPAPAAKPDVPTQSDQDRLAMIQKPATQPPAGGSLGEALRNLQKYVQNESFNNPNGGHTQEFGPAIQFDTKGVEFGPWIRRFVSQVRRNWFVPYAAMSMRGRVVITFNVHRSGAITDVTVVRPSEIDSFNTAAVNALLASNPTEPLPKEYPDDKAFFTVTFFYNEGPPGQQ